MTIEKLHDKYFRLFGDLYYNRALLTEKQYAVMAKILQQQYLEELDVSLTERILEVGITNFELKFKSRMYVPRRGFFGYNRIAKRLLKKYKAEFFTELKKLELDVKEEKDIRKEIDEEIQKPVETQSTALTIVENNAVVVSEDKNDSLS